jgi:hypothetical protein
MMRNSSVVTKRGLEHEVDHLIRHLLVSEIAQMEYQKHQELDQQNLALRAAVG